MEDSVFDPERLHKMRTFMSLDQIDLVLGTFYEEAMEIIVALARNPIQPSGDSSNLHKLKGTCYTMGFNHLGNLAAGAERKASYIDAQSYSNFIFSLKQSLAEGLLLAKGFLARQ
jgi:hypothetical protein